MNPYRHDIFLQGMLQQPERYIGRREELEELLSRVSDSRPAAISLVGLRGLGKSSLLQTLASNPGTHEHFRQNIGLRFRNDPASLLFSFVEGELRPPDGTIAEFLVALLFRSVLHSLAELLELEDARLLPLERIVARRYHVRELRQVAQEQVEAARAEDDDDTLRHDFLRTLGRSNHDRLTSLLERLDGWGLRVIFLMDDFDQLARSLDNESSNMLRTLIPYASMVIATQQPLSEMVAAHIAESPFFNLLEKLDMVSLPYLSPEEARRLVLEPPTWQAATSQFRFSDNDVAFILELTGLHPDVIRATCEDLFNRLRRRSATPDADLIAPDEQPYLRIDLRRQFADSFAVLWRHRLNDEERQTLADFARADKQGSRYPARPPASALHSLIKRGYLVYEEGRYRVFAGFFRDYLLEQLGDALPVVGSEAALPNLPELTDLETRLLELLAAGGGEIVERNEIIVQLYGRRAVATDEERASAANRLDVLVSRLRGKLKNDPRQIENVRGQGYRLARRAGRG
ncbi:MAG: winged helix-turn-helix domain-containing protein [Chloroflexaceae bacterium]|jgi:hypothetical protein|nr:winged helix-turn-helix domain-containing protein [Chloroflexaceae bacterium]